MGLYVPDGWTWRVVEPDGTTVAYDTETIHLKMAGELADKLGLPPAQTEIDPGEGLMVVETDPVSRSYQLSFVF